MDAQGELVGTSSAMGALRRRLSRVLAGAPPPAVLLRGEAGTGKSLIAHLLHREGPRRAGPFLRIDCGNIPPATSAAGLFAPAAGGTLYLEHVGLLPADLQAAVLGMVTGAEKDADALIVAGDTGELEPAVRERRFREDLFQRLAAVTVEVPPLRARGRDALALADWLLARTARDYRISPKRLDRGARAALLEHDWPGNGRELANAIERGVLFSEGPLVTADALGLRLAPRGPAEAAAGAARGSSGLTRDDAVRAQLAAALERTGWNISRAAALLGLARNTVYAHIRKFGLRGGAAPPPRARRAPSPERPAATADARIRWERRGLTLLRADVHPAVEPRSTLRASAALEIAVEKVESFGGRVEELTPSRVVAAFGLDGVEDGPRRAAHAALAIGHALAAARGGRAMSVAIGVHAALMRVGRHRARIAIDAEAAAAERVVLDELLGVAAPGGIALSAPAAALLRARFEVEPLGGAGRVYRLGGAARDRREPEHLRTPFVGRRDELAALAARLRRARDGAGGLVTLVGPAGVGKSRLLWELGRHDGAAAWQVLDMRCVPFARASAEHPVTGLLRAMLQIDARAEKAESRARVMAGLRALREDMAADVPAIGSWLDIPSEDAGWQVLEPADRRRAAVTAITRLLVAQSAVRPVLLRVDDLQWADSETEAVLEDLVAAVPGARLLVVASLRAGHAHPWAQAGGPGAGVVMALEPLAPVDVTRLLNRLIGDDPSLPPAKRLVTAAAEGNPFFLEESVRALVETGALAGERGRYRAVAPVDSLGVPATVQQLLAGRIARLDAAGRALVQCAAALGREPSIALLAAALGETPERLVAGVARLVAAELLVDTRAADGPACGFKHPLTREVAYASLPDAARPALHRRILAALEVAPHREDPDHVERLAYHAFRAEAWDKAVEHLRAAGERAFRRWSNREAEERFTQALGALERWPESRAKAEAGIDVRLSLRDPLWVLGRMDEMRERLDEARALAEGLGDAMRLGWTCCHLARLDWASADHARALASGERALAIATERGDAALAIETRFYVAAVRLAMGEAARAAAMLRENLEALEGGRVGLPRRFRVQGPLLHRGYLSRCLAELGEFPEAVTCVETAVALADSLGNPFSRVTARFGLGNALLRQGRAEDAVAPLEVGVALCREFGLENWRPAVTATLGAAYGAVGRLEESRRLVEAAVAYAEADHILSSHTMWVVYLGESRLRDGRRHEALATARSAFALARERGERGFEAWAIRLLAEIEEERGDLDAAAAWYRQALAMALDLGMRPLADRCRAEMTRSRGGRR
jgi:tetratricopeptide (TPR) repeat protein